MDLTEYISSGIIEMYVMGLCTREEEQELETLRLQHPVLNQAIIDYEVQMETEMQKNFTLPSSETDEKILHSLISLQAPVIPISMKKENKNIWWLKPAAAAAVLLLIVSSYFNYSLYKKNREQELALINTNKKENITSLPLSDYNVMLDRTITPVAMYGVGTHAICRCTMFWDKKTGKMYIMIHHLPLSSSTKDYQLWAMVNGKAINVGLIKDEIRGRFIEMQNVPADAGAFIVTLEKAGETTTPGEDVYLSGKI